MLTQPIESSAIVYMCTYPSAHLLSWLSLWFMHTISFLPSSCCSTREKFWLFSYKLSLSFSTRKEAIQPLKTISRRGGRYNIMPGANLITTGTS